MRTLEQVAKRLVWWESIDETFDNKTRFIAQIMNLGNLEDVRIMLATYSESELRSVLESPPAGVFSYPSWNFWRLKLGLRQKPLPRRFE